ncbi:stage II sporulation protein P [Halonatronum saccharophilum]|uniref:stage II sporulation protein P n=1 Tax=Halonatronum saccharophilum TaxID=150060 RepID=UPI0004851B70|nr:stage II sporulation protein P [Halonatronum saccharophilum]
MLDDHHGFLRSLIIIYFIVVIILSGLLIGRYSNRVDYLVGNIFNDYNLARYLINLIYLDDLHSELILKEGLPIVRVDNSFEQKKDEGSLFAYTLKFITDLPPSFFIVKDDPRVEQVLSKRRDRTKELEEKLLAEGSHQNEKVELDFWQTEPSLSERDLGEIKKEEELKRDENILEEVSRALQGALIGIYHTHTAENYENRGFNARANPGEKGDVVLVGERLRDVLENKYGISVDHSKKVHDITYGQSYIKSLDTAKSMVDGNDDMKMIFDLHRDAIPNGNRNLVTTNIDGEDVAKIMIVVTNDRYGLPHPEWRENLNFARRLASKMDSMYPGLLREVRIINNRRYNQHVHPHALLLEVGGTENTVKEAKRSVELFADVIAALIKEGV